MFKSKAEIRKWGEMVKAGTVSQEQFEARMIATKDIHQLPERVHLQKPKTLKIGRVKAIK